MENKLLYKSERFGFRELLLFFFIILLIVLFIISNKNIFSFIFYTILTCGIIYILVNIKYWDFYENRIEISSLFNKTIQTIQKSEIKKIEIYQSEKSGGSYSFKITLNNNKEFKWSDPSKPLLEMLKKNYITNSSI